MTNYLQWSKNNKIPFFHGTSLQNWNLIKKDGFLFGKHNTYNYSYLTPDINMAKKYGNIILQVNYTPTGIIGIDNYGFYPPSQNEYCWQFSVFIPISIKSLTLVE